jgi:uncharacterized protein (DUF697 family)
MDIDERLYVLQAADGDPALLALVTVDLAHPDLPAEELELIKRALMAAAVPHWCDPAFLAALLAVDVAESERLIDCLRFLTVVEPFPARGERAVNVHESSRQVLREHMRHNMPEQWQTLAWRAREHVAASTSVHARIEALHHLFAIDQEAAAGECESLERAFNHNPEWNQALALSLGEVAAMGWLREAALVRALLLPLQVRFWRGESSSLEPEARALVELAKRSPHPSGLARSHCLLGDVYERQGLLDAAFASFQVTRTIIEGLVQADPSNHVWQLDLAVAESRLGDVYQRQGSHDAALASFKRTVAILERLVTADPSNTGWQRELSVAETRLGDVFLSQGHFEAALASFQGTLPILERFAQSASVHHWNLLLVQARQDAQQAVTGFSAAASAAGLIPFAACAAIAPLQLKMCHQIASCFQVTDYAAETIIGTLGASIGGHAAADFLLSFIPGPGYAIKVATAGSITMALGSALIEYFQERSPLNN